MGNNIHLMTGPEGNSSFCFLRISNISCGYTHLGFGAFRRVNGLGLVQVRFYVTPGDAVYTVTDSPRGKIIGYN